MGDRLSSAPGVGSRSRRWLCWRLARGLRISDAAPPDSGIERHHLRAAGSRPPRSSAVCSPTANWQSIKSISRARSRARVSPASRFASATTAARSGASAVVRSLRRARAAARTPASRCRSVSLGGSGAVSFDLVALKAIQYAPEGASRQTIVDGDRPRHRPRRRPRVRASDPQHRRRAQQETTRTATSIRARTAPRSITAICTGRQPGPPWSRSCDEIHRSDAHPLHARTFAARWTST